MRASEPGESAILLPWLPPRSASLIALARTADPSVWPSVRTDPGAVLLLIRHLPADHSEIILPAAVFRTPAVLQAVLQHWQQGDAREINWAAPDIAPIRRAAVGFARLADLLARRTGACDPACAWAGGLLAPLGWLAVCAADPISAGECLREPDVAAAQRDFWALDAHAIARRLARRWRLPDWLRAIVGFLGLPADTAAELGADDRLFRVVQLAVTLAQANGHDLGLPVGTDYQTLAASLGLTEADLHRLGAEWLDSTDPTDQELLSGRELLPDLLAVAIEKRQLADGPFAERLETEVDRLQESLTAAKATEAERLRKQKLSSLAEFAAGAGHEINNPLAVISGQGQYLLAREADPAKQAMLRGIIRQTERIHQILTDLMQFARPPQPRRQPFDLRGLIAEVIAKHSAAAEAQGTRLDWSAPGEPAPVSADEAMIRTALGCLVRNALEAAAKEGWTRIEVTSTEREWLVAVEDSGPGPLVARREHLFDPFYSGRAAGRGRGLGLPTAWRLATENGGDVRYEPTPASASRFVLALPVCARGTNSRDSLPDELRRSA